LRRFKLAYTLTHLTAFDTAAGWSGTLVGDENENENSGNGNLNGSGNPSVGHFSNTTLTTVYDSGDAPLPPSMFVGGELHTFQLQNGIRWRRGAVACGGADRADQDTEMPNLLLQWSLDNTEHSSAAAGSFLMLKETTSSSFSSSSSSLHARSIYAQSDRSPRVVTARCDPVCVEDAIGE
jgi:hypothetical protein